MTVCVGLFLHFQFFYQVYFSRCCSAWLMADWAVSKRSLSGKYSTPSLALFDSKKLVSHDRFLIFSIRLVNPTQGQGDGLKPAGLLSFPPTFSSIIWASGGLPVPFILVWFTTHQEAQSQSKTALDILATLFPSLNLGLDIHRFLVLFYVFIKH